MFWDQGTRLTSVEVGFGGVWALCPPRLLFMPDRNGDDVPDGEPQVILDGWDTDAVRHNIANGLSWGPTAGSTAATASRPRRTSDRRERPATSGSR